MNLKARLFKADVAGLEKSLLDAVELKGGGHVMRVMPFGLLFSLKRGFHTLLHLGHVLGGLEAGQNVAIAVHVALSSL